MTELPRFDPSIPLCAELVGYLGKSGHWASLRSPLVVAVPYSPEWNDLYNQQFDFKSKELLKAISDGDYSKAVFLHERPFRLEVFLSYEEHYPNSTYWQLLGEVWCDSELPSINQEIWLHLFTDARDGREALFCEEEMRAFEELPDELTVFRGARDGDPMGMSWTLDRGKAEWFAMRFQNALPAVFSANVRKEEILAYFTRRSEAEVVIHPESLRELRKVWAQRKEL